MENATLQISDAVLAAHPKAPRGILMERENVADENVGTQAHTLKTKPIVAKETVFSAGPENSSTILEQNVYIKIAQAFRLAVLLKCVALGKTHSGCQQGPQNRYRTRYRVLTYTSSTIDSWHGSL